MKRVFLCLITVSVLFLHSQTKTNQNFLTTADYRRMLEALENSPDVAIPKPPELCVMGERPTTGKMPVAPVAGKIPATPIVGEMPVAPVRRQDDCGCNVLTLAKGDAYLVEATGRP